MKLSGLAGVLRSAGLTVVETAGWANRGYAGQDLTEVRGVLWHHTATHRSRYDTADAPTLNMCINGRPDLPGPLCQIVLGRNGTVYLAAAGVANHAGRGTAPGIPENAGNHYLIGIEMESSGIMPWDWTLDQLRVAPHLGAALERAYLQHLPEDMRLQLGHKEYSYDGKIDPAGWPGDMDGLRGAINRILSGTSITAQSTTTSQEDAMSADMPMTSKDGIPVTLEDVLNSIDGKVEGVPALRAEFHALNIDLRGDLANKGQQLAAITAANVKLVELLAESKGLSVDDVRAALTQAIADGIKVSVTVDGGKQ